MFLIISCKVSTLENVKQRDKRPRNLSPCSQLEIFIDFDETAREVST